MNEITAGLLVAACVFAGSIVGLLLYPLLPKHHQTTETRDAIRLGIGMISILASLVLGLLTASAKGTFDNADQQIRAYSADLILLDHTLRDYGSDADGIRKMLLQYTDYAVRTTWPEDPSFKPEPLENKQEGELLDQSMHEILALKPITDEQRWLRNHALEIAATLVHTRWSMIVSQQGSVSPILIVIMVAWIFIIFVSFGMNAPRNATVAGAFLLCALAIGASIFLTLEMDTPFAGVIMISSGPMKSALTHLSQ